MIFAAGTMPNVRNDTKKVTRRDVYLDDMILIDGHDEFLFLAVAIVRYEKAFNEGSLDIIALKRKDKNGNYRMLWRQHFHYAACPGRGKKALERITFLRITILPLDPIIREDVIHEAVPGIDTPERFIAKYREVNRWPIRRPDDYPVARILFWRGK